MRLWRIQRTDDVDYDEYYDLVIRAETADDAVAILFKTYRRPFWRYDGFRPDPPNYHVTELTPDGDPGVIVRSFKAG